VNRDLPDKLGGLGDLEDAHNLWAASGQAERGSAGGGLPLGVEEQVHAAEVDERGRGQVEDQRRAALVGVEERTQPGRECGSGGPVELAADVDHRGVGALVAHVDVEVAGRQGLAGAGGAEVHVAVYLTALPAGRRWGGKTGA